MVTKVTVSALEMQSILRSPSYAIPRVLRYSTQVHPNVDVEKTHLPAEKGLLTPRVGPLQHPDFFKVHELFTVRDLFNARVHFGHREGSLDERMKPFIFGSRIGHLIFDLDITAYHLRHALNFVAHIAAKDGIILFIACGPQNARLVERTAHECNEFAHTRYWHGGLFTNSHMQYGAVTRLPDVCIFLNTLNTVLTQHIAVTECAKMCIPSVGIVDTNCNPNLVTYPVPGNDDTPCSIELYCKLFKEAILRGKKHREMHETEDSKSEI